MLLPGRKISLAGQTLFLTRAIGALKRVWRGVQYPVSDGCDSDGGSEELPRGRVSRQWSDMVHCSHKCGKRQVLSESSSSS